MKYNDFKHITALLPGRRRSDLRVAKCPKETEPLGTRRGKVQGGLTWENLGNSEPDKKSMTSFFIAETQDWGAICQAHSYEVYMHAAHMCVDV